MKNFTQDEARVIYNDAKSKGLDPNKVMSQLVLKGATFDGIDMNQAKQYAQSQATPKKQTVVGEALGDIATIGKDVIASGQKRADNIQEAKIAGRTNQQSDLRSIGQIAGQLAGSGADAITAVGKGVVNAFLSDKSEKAVTDVIGKFGAKVMANPEVQNIVNKYNELPEAQQRDIDAAGGVLDLVSNFVGGQVASKGANVAGTGIKKGAKVVGNVVDTGASAVVSGSKAVANSGVGQFGKELAERVPRAVGRAKDNLVEAGVRAEKIKMSTPEVASAIKSNLDERIINTVTEADEATKQAYKQVIDIAEETPKTVGLKKQPSIVGGDLASKQYDLINSQKRKVGEQIGELTKNLSKTERLSMQDSFGQIDDILSNQGVLPQYTKKGVKLDFTGSKYTPAERTKIQELYNLATEGGDNLTPSQIKGKDQLFSKLKRESNFEGIGDLIIETPEGNKSLFNIFRDVYSSKVDTISPEVRVLNSQYRKLSSITDDIEDSIFKTPNFNVTKSVDPAEFAKVNLRRIFGEAQSSPTYQAIADMMDKSARELGYNGATPKQVAEFAEYIRKLYPESVPKTGFQGGIKTGIGDIIETVSKVGAPNIEDQRKALRGLFEDYLQSSKNKITPRIKPKTPTSTVKQGGYIANPLKGKGAIPENSLISEAKKYKSAEEFVKAQEDKLYIHGTQKKIEGNLELKSKASGVQTPEKDAVDVLYVTPNTDTGKMHSRMYTKQNGVTYAIKLKPEAIIFDYTNPAHRKMVAKTMTESQKKLVNDNLVDGQLSWMATPPVKNVKKLGFDGMKQIERKAGEDAYSATFGDAKYSENAESLMLFNKNVFEQVDILKTKSKLTDIWKKANQRKSVK